jgi:hypothetical protein
MSSTPKTVTGSGVRTPNDVFLKCCQSNTKIMDGCYQYCNYESFTRDRVMLQVECRLESVRGSLKREWGDVNYHVIQFLFGRSLCSSFDHPQVPIVLLPPHSAHLSVTASLWGRCS